MTVVNHQMTVLMRLPWVNDPAGGLGWKLDPQGFTSRSLPRLNLRFEAPFFIIRLHFVSYFPSGLNVWIYVENVKCYESLAADFPRQTSRASSETQHPNRKAHRWLNGRMAESWRDKEDEENPGRINRWEQNRRTYMKGGWKPLGGIQVEHRSKTKGEQIQNKTDGWINGWMDGWMMDGWPAPLLTWTLYIPAHHRWSRRLPRAATRCWGLRLARACPRTAGLWMLWERPWNVP